MATVKPVLVIIERGGSSQKFMRALPWNVSTVNIQQCGAQPEYRQKFGGVQ